MKAYVYILTTAKNTTLYTGVSSDLISRLKKHLENFSAPMLEVEKDFKPSAPFRPAKKPLVKPFAPKQNTGIPQALKSPQAEEIDETSDLSTAKKNKEEKAQEVGAEQVHIWRRSYDVPPPALQPDDSRSSVNDPRYAQLKPEEIPLTESLKDTIARFLPCWETEIAPSLKAGRQVLVVAHGNSLRGLIQHLENLTPEQVLKLNIPTAQPLVYELDDALKPIRSYSL